MNTEVSRISRLFQETYEGSPWHGSPVKQVLKGISARQAAMQVLPDTHTIWELVRHIIAWRNFAFQKMAGDKTFDILHAEQDWPYIQEMDEKSWQKDLLALEYSQQTLLQALYKMNNGNLQEIVPGRQYTFYTMLHGIMQHDLYHTGQIALLKKHMGV
jgi:uncharacterized damage-inducible protein DinB